MKKLLMTSFVYFFVIFQAFGQESRLYTEIQQAKKSNVNFKNISFFQEATADTVVLKEFTNPNEVFFFESLSVLSDTGTKAIEITIPLDTNNIVLELLEMPDYFYDYKVVTSSGDTFPANRDIKSYRGAVKGKANSFAAITFYENEAMGLVIINNDNFEITKDKSSGKHIFYNNNNLRIQPQRLNCGTVYEYDSTASFAQQRNANQQGTITRGTPVEKMVRFYVETRYSIFQSKNGSVPAVKLFIQNLFTQVYTIYYKEDIETSISDPIYVWDTPDIYLSSTHLSDFQKKRTSINGDLGILLTFETLEFGEAATLPDFCSSNTSRKLAVASIKDYWQPFPTYSSSVYYVTHELGHLMGSPHTHACVWEVNGMQNQALDACEAVVGNCNPPPPPYVGTIMSYCDGYNFSTGFGQQPGDLIRDRVRNATCLQCAPQYVIDFKNKTVITDTTVTGCGINVQNVNVTNNSKLILESDTETTIDGPFEVQSGSGLEVK
jgi:hypothetical protein